MKLKEIVDKVLKDQNRSLSWLAAEMNKTFDGLKLSLVKGSIKYTDIKKMSQVLEVPAATFFQEENTLENMVSEEKVNYSNLRSELNSCRELATILKNQLADKEKIIDLLSTKP
ncbi:hypothetical protein WG906_10990 [Pedobacter sp. P351]|uniref:hypothetical protein n=1 Tax=Pedobacter superstes TaxID=3133441 RepID=UPI0030B07333